MNVQIYLQQTWINKKALLSYKRKRANNAVKNVKGVDELIWKLVNILSTKIVHTLTNIFQLIKNHLISLKLLTKILYDNYVHKASKSPEISLKCFKFFLAVNKDEYYLSGQWESWRPLATFVMTFPVRVYFHGNYIQIYCLLPLARKNISKPKCRQHFIWNQVIKDAHPRVVMKEFSDNFRNVNRFWIQVKLKYIK